VFLAVDLIVQGVVGALDDSLANAALFGPELEIINVIITHAD
jgi:hypothetical protein